MPDYRCPSCKTVVTFSQKIGTNVFQACPAQQGTGTCGWPISSHNRHYNYNPYGKTSFAHPTVTRQRVQRLSTTRSASAPPLSILTTLPPYTTRVTSLTNTLWTATTTTKIRLAYDDLDPNNPGMQGLIITRPEIASYVNKHGAGTLKAHFEAVADLMQANVTGTDATEGTGEAAAALGVLVYHGQSYEMLWGLSVHRGAGIDQIWGLPHSTKPGKYTDYLIVEAKGPGQALTFDPHRPQGIGQQMSHDWIIDNLARMDAAGHAVATTILQRVGLTTHIPTSLFKYKGGSKSYYALQAHNQTTQKATLSAMVVTAKWTSSGALSYTTSGHVQHY